MPENLRIGRHQAEHRLLAAAPVIRRGGRNLQHRVRLCRGPCLDGQQVADRIGLSEEEPPEHGVVDADVLAPGDQRGPPGPVQVQQVGRVQRGERGTVGQYVPGAHCEAGRAKLAGEVHQHAGERSVLRHRT